MQVEENRVRSRGGMMDRGLYGIGDGVIGLLDGSSITPGREPKYNIARNQLRIHCILLIRMVAAFCL
jgi:hypothetical protein